MSHEHNTDPSRLGNSPSMQVNTRYINSTKETFSITAQELLCESQGGHSGLPIPNNLYSLGGHKATFNMHILNPFRAAYVLCIKFSHAR